MLRRLAGEDPTVNQEWITDKDRFAFTWQSAPDRITTPLVRNADGELEPASWVEALDVAAAGLRAAQQPDDPRDTAVGVAVLPGGRLTLEDAYAYGKFARVALGTNDVDGRARPHSAEEETFLGHHVAGRTLEVTFADLDRAPAVLLVGLEAEEEAGIAFLRLRDAVVSPQDDACSRSPRWRRRGLAAPVGHAAARRARDRGRGAGRHRHRPRRCRRRCRRSSAPPAPSCSSASASPACPAGSRPPCGSRSAPAPGSPGSRAAWVSGPRSRPACCRRCCRAVARSRTPRPASTSRSPGAWSTCRPSPAAPPREILAAARAGLLGGLVVGGLELADLPDPAIAREALDNVSFLVSLEVRHSEVTDRADVVLPGRAAHREVGHLRHVGGAPAPVPAGPVLARDGRPPRARPAGRRPRGGAAGCRRSTPCTPSSTSWAAGTAPASVPPT